MRELARCFREGGGEIKRGRVLQLKAEADGRTDVLLENKTFSARRVIVATGAWSKPLLRQLGYRVPLDTERGYHLMLPEPGVGLTRPMTSFERSFVMTPMEEGLRLAGTVELAGLKAEPDYRRADILFEHAQAILPGLRLGEAKRWMGFRPTLPDSLPVIGRAPRQRNIYFAFGHQHLGLTQAAVTAEIVGDLIAGREPEVDVRPLAVDRF